MTEISRISFAKLGQTPKGTVIVLAGEGIKLGAGAKSLGIEKLVRRAAKTADFSGKSMKFLDILAPANTSFERLVVVGTGKVAALGEHDWLRLGGAAMGVLKRGTTASIVLERPDGRALDSNSAADFSLGLAMRSYTFDKYKPSKAGPSKNGNGKSAKKQPAKVTVLVDDPARVRAAWKSRSAIAEGVVMARDLVNEPANVLGPIEFAKEAASLKSLGVGVEVLNEKQMAKLGMRALLGVAQGSRRPPRLVIMQWNGGRSREKPIAFVGKGVVFDTGGVSIKPSGGMEDMKGDMAGAATVTGLMRALAGRKAKVNAIGIIGLVENMADGNAQRPGDIVEAMSGRTIEIINTDAEGRLVLADALHYTETRFKPKFMIDLATLTGAVIVALGHQYAGLFANDDDLAENLRAAGEATGEGVWRLPLLAEYDKIINSKFADVKNSGGRAAGSITAAQFLKRFVKDTPWAHLDVAGTAMGSPQTEINRSWASGYGVRLLDRLVSDAYEG
jgi:leucyl aminopeptidase